MAGKVRNLQEKNGLFYARLAVPAELRTVVGKRELVMSLGSNRRIATQHLPAAIASFHDELLKARRTLVLEGKAKARPTRLASLGEIAVTHYAEELAIDTRLRNATSEDGEPIMVADDWSHSGQAASLRRVASGRVSDAEIGAVIGWAVNRFRDRDLVKAERGSPEWREIGRTLAMVQMEAFERARERDAGNFTGEPKLPILKEQPAPASAPTAKAAPSGPPVKLRELFKGYLQELQASGKGAEAARRWTSSFDQLIEFLGHEDARQITRGDLVRWKDDLIAKGRAPKTVRDVHLGSLKAVLNWAVANDRLESHPAEKVTIKVHKANLGREKGFTDIEASELLKIAADYHSPEVRYDALRESRLTEAAKRWAPWLCAFTGARVAEITQLRKEDIHQTGDIVFIRITPDAGGTKTGTYRDVPLHPQIIERGFLAYVEAAQPGPLFYAQSVRRSPIHPSKQVAKRLATWVRSLKIIPDSVDPNHGWRHRFKTISRELGLDPRVIDAIQGHAARTAGEDYGDVTLLAKHSAIKKLKNISI